jgi:hypothetical protein
MNAPSTGQRSDARRLLRRIVGPPPKKAPGKVASTLFLLVFVVGISATALSWLEDPSLIDLSLACSIVGGLLSVFGNLAAHHRWRGELAGDLVRLGGMMMFFVAFGLLMTEMVLTGQWEWVWWSAFVLGLLTVVFVAGHYYGPNDRPDPEDGTSARRGPSN